jgi:hypothetical protein
MIERSRLEGKKMRAEEDGRRRKKTGKKRMNIQFWGRRRNGLNDNFNWAV